MSSIHSMGSQGGNEKWSASVFHVKPTTKMSPNVEVDSCRPVSMGGSLPKRFCPTENLLSERSPTMSGVAFLPPSPFQVSFPPAHLELHGSPGRMPLVTKGTKQKLKLSISLGSVFLTGLVVSFRVGGLVWFGWVVSILRHLAPELELGLKSKPNTTNMGNRFPCGMKGKIGRMTPSRRHFQRQLGLSVSLQAVLERKGPQERPGR